MAPSPKPSFSAIAATLLALAVPAVSASGNTTCPAGLYMIVARGSNEPQGVGRIGVVPANVSLAIPDSFTDPVVWPATFDNYFPSEEEGTAAMTSDIKSYADRCPGSKIALIGYSQGGQVVMDTLCGTSEYGFNVTDPLDSKYAANIVAAVTFGDPSKIGGQPWNRGNATSNGIFNRTNPAGCGVYTNLIRGWCDEGDRYCASGNITTVHGNYFAKYGFDAADFIVEQFRASLSGANSTSNSTTTTSSPTGTAAPTSTGAGSATTATGSSKPTTTVVTGASTGLRPLMLGAQGLAVAVGMWVLL